jgi:hypothetical protein
MPSPKQSPERARLRAFIEQRVVDLDLSWRDLERLSGVPYETTRRVRTGARPISRETIEGLEDGLRWERGSIRAILSGGDPTPLPDGPRMAVEDHALDTPIGRVAYQVIRDLDADDTLTPEARAELEATIAERMRHDAELFIRAMRAERDA